MNADKTLAQETRVEQANRSKAIGGLLTSVGLLCIVLVSGGCSGLPLHSPPTGRRVPPPVAAPPTVTPQRSAEAAASAHRIVPPSTTPTIMPVAHTSAAADHANERFTSDATPVGFRRSVRVGDTLSPTGDCVCQSGPCAGVSGDGGCFSGESDRVPCHPAPHGYAMPPMMPPPWLYDPQEFLCNGEDQDPNAVLTQDDRIIGLQPMDTVSHYTTQDGDIEFTASNRVCLYSPRFGNVRRITGALQGEGAIAVAGTIRPVGPQGIVDDLPGLVMTDSVEVDQAEITHRIDSMRDRNRGVRIQSIEQPLLAANVLDVLAGIQNVSISQIDESLLAMLQRHAVAANIWTLQETVEVEIQDLAPPVLTRDQKVDALVVYEFPDAGRLNLIKIADKQHAAIGDTVTFALRLQNVGDSAVSGVVVADSLTTRLEYIADSQTASVDAEFETKLNSAISSQLIWRLKEELAVGDSVTFEFQCRVR